MDASHRASCKRPISEAAQKFCPQCGQPTPAHRIDWHFLSHEIQHSIFHVDKGILYTLKHLLTRPGAMIREYLEGNRAGHFKPVLLVMILGAVASLVSKWILGSADKKFWAGWSDATSYKDEAGAEADIRIIHVMQSILEWTSEHIALVLVLLVPFFAAAMRLAFHSRRSQLNYPEWLVVSCFLVAQALCIYIMMGLISKVIPWVGAFDLLPMVIVQCITVVGIFNTRPWWKTTGRFLVGLTLYVMLFTLLVMAVGVGGLIAANGFEAFMEQVRQ